MKPVVVALFLFLAPMPSMGSVFPPLKNGVKVPEISVIDETNRKFELSMELAKTGKPVLLLPFFTSCHMSCPLIVQSLLQVWDLGTGFNVALFSFDPKETSESLREFRKREKIPAEWRLLRSSDGGAVRAFFDVFSYSIMSSDGGFNHPNQILVFNGSAIWTGSLFGSQLTKKDLAEALKASPENPNRLAIIGISGILLSLTILFSYLFYFRPASKAS